MSPLGGVAANNGLVTARFLWHDTAQLVSPVTFSVGGVPIGPSIEHDFGSTEATVVLHFWRTSAAGLTETAHALAEAGLATMSPLQRDACRFRGVETATGTGPRRQVEFWPVIPVPGLHVIDSGAATTSALLVTLQTERRPRKITGRMHIPGVRSGLLDPVSGWVRPQGHGHIREGLMAFYLAQLDAGLQWVVANPYRVESTPWPVTGWTVARQLVAQRRRRYDDQWGQFG